MMITVAAARVYVRLWRKVFPLAPASVCLTLMEIESSFVTTAHAIPTPEALARGVHPAGAWGLLQLLQPTAADMVKRLTRMRDAGGLPVEVINTLTAWDGEHPACLTDPALGSLLGVAYIDHIAERFGQTLAPIAAAYHNGPGFLADFLAHGKHLPDDLPPKGQAYVKRAIAVWPRYQDADNEGGPTSVA